MPSHGDQIARMRWCRGLRAISTRFNPSMTGGTHMATRPRRPVLGPCHPPTGFFGERARASTVPGAAGFCSCARHRGWHRSFVLPTVSVSSRGAVNAEAPGESSGPTDRRGCLGLWLPPIEHLLVATSIA